MKKGFLYTLEAMIASLLILSSLLLIYNIQEPKSEKIPIELGYNCLKEMDYKGFLRNYVLNNDVQQINNYLDDCLPKTIDSSISFGEQVTLPTNVSVVIVDYLIAGEKDTFNPVLINLYMWSKI